MFSLSISPSDHLLVYKCWKFVSVANSRRLIQKCNKHSFVSDSQAISIVNNTKIVFVFCFAYLGLEMYAFCISLNKI